MLPMVSVVIPCRNERRYLAACMDSVLDSDYPNDRFEILIVDGVSEDRSAEIAEAYSQKHSSVRLLSNPGRITPAALNVGIRGARGSVIVRMDAHARVDRNYIRLCVEALVNSGADNVGGNMVTLAQDRNWFSEAIIASMSHSFGVGNSHFRVNSSEPRWVDTVFGGCYRREVFERVGFFNEGLSRGQDMEFNRRLIKAGGKILLVPGIVSYYYIKSDLWSFLQHNWRNGMWAILPFRWSDGIPVSLRHLVPMIFALALLASAALSPFLWMARWVLLILTGTYAGAALVAATEVAFKKRSPGMIVLMPLVFASLHLPYGFGSLWGAVCLTLNIDEAKTRICGAASETL